MQKPRRIIARRRTVRFRLPEAALTAGIFAKARAAARPSCANRPASCTRQSGRVLALSDAEHGIPAGNAILKAFPT